MANEFDALPPATHPSRLVVRGFFYAAIISGVSIFVITAAKGGLVAKDAIVLVLFLEGGLGLIAGAVIALSNTPSIARTSQLMFKTAPWSRGAERHAERVGLRWMVTSFFLIIIGAIVSLA